MCGFYGFLSANHPLEWDELLRRGGELLAHRGPDGTGRLVLADDGVAFAHRRLAIVDLSDAGHQPMYSLSGRYVIVFNGEIYNHLDIRQELDRAFGKRPWRGHSDTETLLAAVDAWGILTAIQRTVGMFAFSIWDKLTRQLTLGRDRLGEKPLYYGWQQNGAHRAFLFGSELKALRSHPAFGFEIDRDAMDLQLRRGYVPAPYSIYTGISKLMPGSLLTVSLQRPEPHIKHYWSGAEVAAATGNKHQYQSVEDSIDALEEVLKQSIQSQMVADVPLGAFLSGGVDSSVIVALMQAQASRPVKTFSIGFHEKGFDESKYARDVARHLGTDHTELCVSADEAMQVIPALPAIYDEPFSDSSQIPTILVSRMARQSVTVSLSGDGGDELFCGYNRYSLTSSYWKYLRHIPLPLRCALGRGIKVVPAAAWDKAANAFALVKGSGILSRPGEKFHKAANVIPSRSLQDLYTRLISQSSARNSVLRSISESPGSRLILPRSLAGLDDVSWMMAMDMLTYLPDDILTKVDRAAMSASLETRAPFLDHRVVEFAWRIPTSLKLRDGRTKWILRKVLDRHVPSHLIDRPKMGFGIPVGDWLRGALREWAESMLSESRLKSEGFLDPIVVRKKWNNHLVSDRGCGHGLWNIIQFQSWLEENG